MNLIEIAKGWYNLANGTQEIKNLAESRLIICDSCPEKLQISRIGQVLITTINQKASTFYCSGCNCPLASKTTSITSKCPSGKW